MDTKDSRSEARTARGRDTKEPDLSGRETLAIVALFVAGFTVIYWFFWFFWPHMAIY